MVWIHSSGSRQKSIEKYLNYPLYLYTGNWYRLIIEAVQAQPVEFGTGYFAGRLWINGAGQSRTYFGGVSNLLFHELTNIEISICARWTDNQSALTLFGNYDAMNLIWFKGAEGLYVPPESILSL